MSGKSNARIRTVDMRVLDKVGQPVSRPSIFARTGQPGRDGAGGSHDHHILAFNLPVKPLRQPRPVPRLDRKRNRRFPRPPARPRRCSGAGRSYRWSVAYSTLRIRLKWPVFHERGLAENVDNGHRHLHPEGVGEPHRSAAAKVHRLLPPLLDGDVRRMQVGPVGCVSYRVQPTSEAGDVAGRFREDGRAAAGKTVEGKHQAALPRNPGALKPRGVSRRGGVYGHREVRAVQVEGHFSGIVGRCPSPGLVREERDDIGSR